MIRFMVFLLFSNLLVNSANGYSLDSNKVRLHIQVYDEGICRPMLKSTQYNYTRFRQSKSVLQSGEYYSTLFAYVNSTDSGLLNPQSNHQLQSSSLELNPKLEYELVLLKYDGFNRASPDSMIIKVSKLENDAQIILTFKSGKFKLRKMKFFKKLNKNSAPNFNLEASLPFKNTLKLDSVSYYKNGKRKANYFIIASNFPLFYVQEFDSANPAIYAQGFRMLSSYQLNGPAPSTLVWSNKEYTKYGYWEYFENEKRIKHEMWASMLHAKFEWYSSGQLKSETHLGQSNKEMKHTYYLENGAIKEEYQIQTAHQNAYLKSYVYSPEGKVILINTYKSLNGISKQELQKRELFYPSGKLKMKESVGSTYTIKYYKEDGTERIN